MNKPKIEDILPLLRAVAALNSTEGRERFVMMGPRAMVGILKMYNDLPSEWRGFVEAME